MSVDDLDEFGGGIDINQILNDASLNAELISLGWTDAAHHPVVPKNSAIRKPPTNASDNAVKLPEPPILLDQGIVEILDIDTIGLVDESNLTLTEHDLQDQGLLDEYEMLTGGGGHTQLIGAAENTESEQLPEIVVPIVAPGRSQLPSPPLPVKPPRPRPAVASNTPSIITPASSPAPAPAPVSTPQLAPAPTGNPTVEEAKKLALKYKREGNSAEALKWLRYSKQVQASSTTTPPAPAPAPAVASASSAKLTSQNPSSAAGAATVRATSAPASSGAKSAPIGSSSLSQQPTRTLVSSTSTSSSGFTDTFSPLEVAILEASKLALNEAKRNEKSDTKQAVVKMREYKALQQELLVLQSRRQTPGAVPALFHWETTKKETVVENVEIAEDEVRVTIEGAYDIAGIVEAHSSRALSVSFTLGIAKEEPAPTVTPQAKYEAGKVEFASYSVVQPVLKRSRHVQALYARKKATFDLVLNKGFWKGSEVLCQAVLPLNDLLTKSRIGGPLALKTVSKEGGARSKTVGGQLTVYVSIRSPLMGPEVLVVEERRLVVGAWPAVVAPVATTTPALPISTPITADTGAVSILAGSDGAANEDAAIAALEEEHNDSPVALSAPAATLSGPMALLTEKEKTDPHSVDFLESNDVLEQEIVTAEALVIQPNLDEDDKFNATMRLQLLQVKMQVLVFQVQNETLSLEDYLAKLKERVKKDQVMALYFKTLGDKESIGTALAIMKRIQTMKKEIQNAEE